MEIGKLSMIIGIILIIISIISILPSGVLTIGMFLLLLIGILITIFGFIKKE